MQYLHSLINFKPGEEEKILIKRQWIFPRRKCPQNSCNYLLRAIWTGNHAFDYKTNLHPTAPSHPTETVVKSEAVVYIGGGAKGNVKTWSWHFFQPLVGRETEGEEATCLAFERWISIRNFRPMQIFSKQIGFSMVNENCHRETL